MNGFHELISNMCEKSIENNLKQSKSSEYLPPN
jgi:hypothetical protein